VAEVIYLGLDTDNKTEDLLLRWLQKAIKWAKIQGDAVAGIEHGLTPDQLARWKKLVLDWELDHSKPDPYEEREEGEGVSKCTRASE
jgi:hypothetical protein